MRNTESGRSMVEMLGVLAIIGVLSVGGIAGYTMAMNKHRANETIGRLMNRAVVVSGQRQLGQTASLSGFNENDGAYTIPNNVDTNTEGKFKLTIQNIPESVCSKIITMEWKIPVITPESCSGTSDMTFQFNNDLSENTGSSDEGESCAGVKCGETCCTNGSTCDAATNRCTRAGKVCPEGEVPYRAYTSDPDATADAYECCDGYAQDETDGQIALCCHPNQTPYHYYNLSSYDDCCNSTEIYNAGGYVTSGCCCEGGSVAVPKYDPYTDRISGCACGPIGSTEAYWDFNVDNETVFCEKGVDHEFFAQNGYWRCIP
ncbi:MAG: hypothetical protein II938_00150 [Alphaproteobacteria bacterium]|nr:hypothetical protein [Alphaproteobacteria bacterium]